MLKYEYLQIKNFRGFKDLKLNNFSRVNLFVGKNAVGKTAILEAIFIHSGGYNPELAFRVNHFRGVEVFKVDPLKSSETPWNSLFNEYKIDVPIEIISNNKKGHRKTILKCLNIEKRIKLVENIRKTTFGGANLSAEAIQVLELISETSEGEKRNFYMIIDQGRISSFPVPLPPSFPCVFLGAMKRSSFQEMAERFSELTMNGEFMNEIINLLKIFEPRLKDIKLLVVGNVPILHADIGMKRLIPIYYLSYGLVKAIDIGLSMFSVRDGVLLIDEIENGIHYSILEDYWLSISKLANIFNVQVFATTHSYECLAAAHRAFSKSKEYDFKLYRLEKIKEDIKVIDYSKDELETSLEMGFEIR
ncbi:AAA family ATPase [Thermosipho atlanticus]|uniref:ATPase/GTPase, AAA15 family n=1 Tax=Thermosipho atlanticus DSM 15807 TaxID=1123380 RepID=A0A1M5RNE2_9BACT|nr:AAA family ATPase [Thermosipho atlanticus]SHH27679.1 ATPase/GTPase, AAA15 family [Thermosipho atlanticus DSM 15807]